MKLFIILSVIACSYAEKLDRTYLPPESASTAGGSPGSLTAPGSYQSGPGSFNVPSSFVQPSGAVSGTVQSPGPKFTQTQGQPSGSPIGQTSGSTYPQGPNQISTQSGLSQPIQSGINQPIFNQAGVSPQASRPDFGQGSAGLNQESVLGGQAQGPGYFAQQQPERARASIDRNAEILRYDNQNNGDTYSYSFETSNGISAEQSGVATNGVRAQGAFAYTGDDGQRYSIVYTADENGYQPRGDHLPTPPPIPDAILKSLEDNARAAAAGTQEGAYNPNEDIGATVGPQQNSNIYPGQGQPGQTSTGYQPGRGVQGGLDNTQINYQAQVPTSQFNVPISSSQVQSLPVSQNSLATNAPYAPSNSPGSANTDFSASQQDNSVSSLSSSITPGVQGRPSQSPQSSSSYNTVASSSLGTRPTSSLGSSPYGASNISPSVSAMPGNQVFNKDSGYQYNTPSSIPGRFGPQVSIGQNSVAQYSTPGLTSTAGTPGIPDFTSQGRPSIQSQNNIPSRPSGNLRPGFQSPDTSRPNQPTASFGMIGGTAQNGYTSGNRLPLQNNQQSGYNYNAPSKTSPFGSQGSSQNNQLANSQFGAPAKSPSGTNSINIPAISPTGTQRQPQGQSQYVRPVSVGSSNTRPADSQISLISKNQSPQYTAPSSAAPDAPTQSLSTLQQRPQLGSPTNSGPTGSRFQAPVGQGQGDGYQYNKPQNQLSRPGQTGTAFPRPSGSEPTATGSLSPLNSFNQQPGGPSQYFTASNPTQGSKTDLSGYNYTPSRPIASGPGTSSNELGNPNSTGPTGQGYSSGPNTSGASNSAAANIGQGSGYSQPGQYSPSVTIPGATATDLTRPGSSTSQYRPVQSSENKSPLGESGYQYNRPGSSLGPSSGSTQNGFNSQVGFGSNSSGQNISGAEGSQSGFGPSRQDKPSQSVPGSGYAPSAQDGPGQLGSGPSGLQRPVDNFGGPRQPPSFSEEEGYKY